MRGLNSDNVAATSAEVTTPHWFIRMGFDTPIRLTTAPSINWTAQGGAFAKAEFDVRDPTGNPVVSVFNSLVAFGVTVLTDGTAGRELKIWQAYKASGTGSSLAGYADPVLLFDGEMGAAEIDDVVTIRGERWQAKFTPRLYVQPPAFNHLPKRGDVIQMPNQKVILE